MNRHTAAAILAACAACLAFGQSGESLPKFEAADVHVSPKPTNPNQQFMRVGASRKGRYEIRNATMVDLLRLAYGLAPDKIVGGPNWLELDHFDVIAKVPDGVEPKVRLQMLESLLQDRFKLVTHKEDKPLPTYALSAGSKPKLKEASGSEESGCKPKGASGPPNPGVPTLMLNGGAIVLGPGGAVTYQCRNITMAVFVEEMRRMLGANLGTNPIHDETGLKGNWDFELSYSIGLIMPMPGDTVERIPITTAVEKQLGLKLEQRPIPTSVIVVDSVNRKPTDNPPGTAEALPPIPPPKEFEVATVKATDPNARVGGGLRMQPGGRFTAQGMPLRFLLNQAFRVNNNDGLVGVPAFAMSDRYDITAKAPEGVDGMDPDTLAPMLLSLLADRFGLKYHTEQRQVQAYSLVAAKPKLKKADPESRIYCRNDNAPPGSPPGSRMLTCQNATMALLAERLQGIGPDLNWPVENATGIEGGWDLSLVFSMLPVGFPGPAAADPNRPAAPVASDPSGGYTIFEAIEKQLGLKLEKQKRTMPIIVIDHLEQKPTEN